MGARACLSPPSRTSACRTSFSLTTVRRCPGTTARIFPVGWRRARKHIEEEILQMKCPRAGCRRAFFDFEGCFALSCSACPCKFCGWCLQDCGNGDAHPHVRGCGKVPQGVDALFPQMPDVGGAFEKTHNRSESDSKGARERARATELI